MQKKKRNKQAIYFLMVAALFAAIAFAAAVYRSSQVGKVDYLEHLDDVAVTVDGEDYRLRDLAFYIAYEEGTVEEQAEIYDSDKPSAYWNMFTNSSFMRNKARTLAMEMAVHDIIFYQMAEEDGAALTQEDEKYLKNQMLDFWSDLEDDGRERIGISEDEMGEAFHRMALAQKEQQIVADREGVNYREYEMDGDAYESLLREHSYEVNEGLWERLDFGNITLNPER